jgi:hypothetical protein
MTVADLIEHLQTMPREDAVYFDNGDHDQPVTRVTMHQSHRGVILR